jgi:hypothetical protein
MPVGKPFTRQCVAIALERDAAKLKSPSCSKTRVPLEGRRPLLAQCVSMQVAHG